MDLSYIWELTHAPLPTRRALHASPPTISPVRALPNSRRALHSLHPRFAPCPAVPALTPQRRAPQAPLTLAAAVAAAAVAKLQQGQN